MLPSSTPNSQVPAKLTAPSRARAPFVAYARLAPRGWTTARRREPEGDCTLAQLSPGARATIARIQATGPMGAHLLEMGLTPGTPICLRHRGWHRRVEISVRAYVFSLPVEEASLIRVTTHA